MNNNETLIIFKIDKKIEGLLIPIVEYEIYNPKIGEQLDLNICKDVKIDLLLPVNIDEDKIFKYVPRNDYYNNICFIYKTEKDTDITIADRKTEFNNNNLSLCEVNCEYDGYNNETKKVKCECQIKSKKLLSNELVINKNGLLNNFIDIKNITNFKIII